MKAELLAVLLLVASMDASAKYSIKPLRQQTTTVRFFKSPSAQALPGYESISTPLRIDFTGQEFLGVLYSAR